MRRRFFYLLLSLFIVAGSGQAFADGNNHRGGKDRKEQSHNRPGGNSNKKNDKNKPGHNSKPGHSSKPGHNVKPGNNHNHGNNFKPGNNRKPENNFKPGNNHRPGDAHKPAMNHKPAVSAPRPGAGGRPMNIGHPAPPPHHHNYGPALPPPPPRLPHMVSHVTRGCHDVNVWQIDYDTYIVKYRRGGHWYTQYVYPYADRYSNPTLISVNWQPLSRWSIIPPIQLNINL